MAGVAEGGAGCAGRLKNELRCTAGDQQLRALKFAVHFVGDIHQPFHAIWESSGGNGIAIKVIQLKGKTCTADHCSTPPDNLHKMWDTTLIRAMEYNWPTFVDDLEAGWLTSDVAKIDTKAIRSCGRRMRTMKRSPVISGSMVIRWTKLTMIGPHHS
ncbi:S1/P1 nuclease [Bradyrhizobium sp. CCGUVB1N3]|uniref:S1/P1 nuclease n=1 Tax=Bradyrhizobium sp. CCGUVB1N3 TaxID=2949629 RepID=UPI0035326EAC